MAVTAAGELIPELLPHRQRGLPDPETRRAG